MHTVYYFGHTFRTKFLFLENINSCDLNIIHDVNYNHDHVQVHLFG